MDDWFGVCGSSPHTRGAPVGVEVVGERTRIIPAYAGSTPGLGQWSRRDVGSSPHTRGARQAILPVSSLARIIPAYAGSTLFAIIIQLVDEDHPRIRGEHELRTSLFVEVVGSSPHTRGAPRLAQARLRRRRIIPAYAGSTSGGRRALSGSFGSSPHTRGARVAVRD